jgi:MFS transporter, FSR family, fosmidomycin resistance protein
VSSGHLESAEYNIVMRTLLPTLSFIVTLLLIEFLDEFAFGTREAAWPLIRTDLGLTYVQIGLLLTVPNLIGNLVEPIIGIWGDIGSRRKLILGGGVVFALALGLVAVSGSFVPLLVAFIVFYPASGAFVSLSQAALMDSEPNRHEQNMARWTLAGSLGIVIGPLALGVAKFVGLSWRTLFLGFAILTGVVLIFATRLKFTQVGEKIPSENPPSGNFLEGLRGAWQALKRKEVLRWLTLLQFADLTLDIFHGYLALYFVDVVRMEPVQAGFAVAIWTGCGLLGDFLLIPLLEKVPGLVYLRVSAVLVLGLFPLFLLVPLPAIKLIILGLLGLLNAGWYAIPKGQLYSVMPGQSGRVMTVGNIFNLVGSLIPLGIGLAAERVGLQNAMWLIILGPIVLILGIPKLNSRIKGKEIRA